MSTAAQEAKAKRLNKSSKYETQVFTRCELCGRSRGYHRYFKLCRICLRRLAQKGDIPGLKKSSW